MSGELWMGVIPWMAIVGLFGILLKVRVTGDPALWKRVDELEEKLERQRMHFEEQLASERRDCANKLREMEGRIRQMQQQQTSFGNLADNAASLPLKTAFRPVDTDQDDDLVQKLNEVPSRRRRGK